MAMVNGKHHTPTNAETIEAKKRKISSDVNGNHIASKQNGISQNGHNGNLQNGHNGTLQNGHKDKFAPMKECGPVDLEDVLARRHVNVGRATEIHYPQDPLYIHHGKGQYLFDENNTRYLDLMNNVANVGHCHPHVTKAGSFQMSELSTNSRFLHHQILKVAEDLKKTLPKELSVCFFVNSGTEANDLAMRLAKQYTSHKDCVVIDHAYHGHSMSVIDISPYKFKNPKGSGQTDYIHVLDSPDSYKGKHQGDNEDDEIGRKYAEDAIKVMDEAVSKGRKIGMFIAESLIGCGGQVILPAGYLKRIYAHVRKLGGICVADEVQTGFARAGKHGFWAFERQGVVPDIISIGKPMGNGHPVACVVTTEAVAQALEDTEICYFNTFGGNPVSMAIASACMEVIRDEKLQENAATVGEYTMAKLRELKEKHEIIGDVRGIGLFLGIELVKSRQTKEPATSQTKRISYLLRQRGVLISGDGPGRNVLKVKPPLCVTKDNMDMFVEQLDKVLTEFEREQKM